MIFKKKMKKLELLSPAGDFISLRAAITSGADAVYFGIKGLNMRANAKNFLLKDLNKIVKLCHENDVKVYLTLNTIIYEKEIKKVEKIVKKAKEIGVDAIIAWDFAILKLCKENEIRIHLSTQASVSNYSSAEYYHKKFGVKRIVLARECTLLDVKSIIGKIKKNKLNLEIETFVHGAMCVSVSGRCFISQFQFNRSANRGDCIQPCRREYIVIDSEEKHKFSLGNDFVMSPKDLCTLPFLEKLIKVGIDSFKIEGRNRSPEYVKTVVSVYKEFLDFYTSLKRNEKELEKKKKELIERLKTVYNRGFSSGFFMGREIESWTDSYGSKATKKKIYVGKVVNYYPKVKVVEVKIEAGSLKAGDDMMIQGTTTGVFEQKIESMQLGGKNVKSVVKGKNVGVRVTSKVRKNDKVYTISFS